ncbi:hypothetical protein I6G82_02445 [Lysinibacillus macroides]|uniref:Uncharacterized protein n=1 Tax=Lysinibacillus macroides TaxID=33935 RepID=A0A0N0CV92_9BACI|nr:hypothetical protein [Lysinibacillus macroides]KOY81321.1 hypothetical protein ADM90_19520 [Lysinibacillus macroides]QPR68512.1 hypothetical protein I6G82_02445 [Lysinibacillus macroides]
MNIEQLKKLEDLKQTQTTISELLTKAEEVKVNRLIQDSISEFSSFFETKGFEVSKSANFTKAVYGTSEFILHHDISDKRYFIFHFIFELECKTFDSQQYSIGINPKPSNDGSYAPRTSGDSLQWEIEKIERSIHILKQELETVDTNPWCFSIKNDTEKEYSKTTFDSMDELLNELFQ